MNIFFQKRRITLLIMLSFSCLFFIACNMNNLNNKQSVAKKQLKNSSKQIEKKIIVNQVINISAPKAKTKSPVSTAINETKWKMSNGKTIHASQQDIVWHTQLNNESVVVLKVPTASVTWYNFIFLNRKKNNWGIAGLADEPLEKKYLTGKKGIKWPSKRVSFDHLQLSKEKKEWLISSKDHAAVIIKKPRTAFSSKGFKHVHLSRGREFFTKTTEQGINTGFYFDDDFVIWISGNLNSQDFNQLAESLPEVTNSNFPLNNNQ